MSTALLVPERVKQKDMPAEDPVHEAAEKLLAERFPVLFAIWDTCADGETSWGALAWRMGVRPERIRLICQVAEHVLDELEQEERRRSQRKRGPKPRVRRAGEAKRTGEPYEAIPAAFR